MSSRQWLLIGVIVVVGAAGIGGGLALRSGSDEGSSATRAGGPDAAVQGKVVPARSSVPAPAAAVTKPAAAAAVLPRLVGATAVKPASDAGAGTITGAAAKPPSAGSSFSAAPVKPAGP